MLRTYRRLPEIISGYALDDVWSVVVPLARTNIVLNPSFETNTTGYTAVGASIARSTLQQYHGAYSLQITPTAGTSDGVFYGTVSLISGTVYAFSLKVRGQAGVKYKISFATTGGVDLVAYRFTATGRWQWVSVIWNETSTTTRRLYLSKDANTSTHIFYTDGWQCEACEVGNAVPTTHIDGDQLGLVPNQSPPAYVWNGTPHASTSTRSGLTRAGGMVIPFKRYGFILTAMIGLGLAAPLNVATDYARIDGSYDDYTRKPSRQFTLAGRFQGRTYAELRRNRGGLAQLLDRDLIGQDQRLTLLRHVEDRNGSIVSSTVRALAKYESGLGGNTDNSHAEAVPITFTQYLPNILSDGEDGESLSVQLSVADADYILKRSAAGVWSALGSGITGTRVFSILVARSGRVYVGGNFTSAGGVANTAHIAYWDGSAWNAMGTGVTGGSEVACLIEMPDGSIIAGGNFTAMGGVANTLRLASYNPTTNTWSALSTGANGTVISLAVGSTGLLYLGGSFTSIGGVAATRAASWNGAAFSALGAGMNSPVNSMITGADGNIYAGGVFTTPFSRVAVWDTTTLAWGALGAGLPGTVAVLGFGSNNVLYAASDATAGYFNAWNGTVWTQLSTAFSGAGPAAMQVLPNGEVWLGGAFNVAGLPLLTDSLVKAIPTGAAGSTVLLPVGVDLPGVAGVYAIQQSVAGDLYIGFDTSGSALVEVTTSVTNPGTARSYPTLTINGPSSGTSQILGIINYTTNRAIYMNYTMSVGEIATLVLQPDAIRFTSNTQGNVAGTILPGSNTADFFLSPGVNTISFFSASSTVTATLSFRPAYASIDDVI